ncbi:ParB/RepB/Spo0J family partition protein [Herbiconiux sp. CPCC 203407]|uniref:ParB/RepB/Spo0J family partition protein n=1 Tax=Herbiconiux oxytropis TaxID=2970915 RepID=A0AA41XEU3_9MICO|nr:ParB/RepB/Spo0J family partition protein [Herbiconiux oxytropis]MCS5723182.1 ParB/RepB/Spo0J family partition protein [Herbiconiux oxytropis]MCS5725143.1 ParB/RepB/Spo0J family partition protein [Herbiconiux oxytropis]
MATKKRAGLGRGIGALIPTDTPRVEGSRPVDVFFDAPRADGTRAGVGDTRVPAGDDATQLLAVPGARLAQLDPNSIVPNAKQPRSVFDPADLAELVHSVREIGVLQPIIVRELPREPDEAADAPQRYELVMGERRLRATKEAGLDTIPAVIKHTADEDMLRDALLENLHRSQLNPLEEASAYQQLLDDFGITQEQLAERIGRSRPQITNTLRLLRLPPAVQSRVAAGVLSAGHARAVLAVGDVDAMTKLADKIVNEDLSVRAAEALASEAPKQGRAKTTAGTKRGHLDEIGERLGDRLNTRVRVSLGRSKGQIVIDFATIEDLNRILTELGEDGYGSNSPRKGPHFV